MLKNSKYWIWAVSVWNPLRKIDKWYNNKHNKEHLKDTKQKKRNLALIINYLIASYLMAFMLPWLSHDTPKYLTLLKVQWCTAESWMMTNDECQWSFQFHHRPSPFCLQGDRIGGPHRTWFNSWGCEAFKSHRRIRFRATFVVQRLPSVDGFGRIPLRYLRPCTATGQPNWTSATPWILCGCMNSDF